LSDDEATIFMVDSNLQREKLLPSEKAFAYKMKYDALKHQRKIPANQLDSSVRQVVAVVRSDDLLGDEQGDSGRQVQRYIRLTFLIPELLTMVDNNELDLKPKMAMSPAVEISFLKENEQLWLLDVIEKNESTPSHAQAITFKEMSKCGTLTKEEIEKQMLQLKPNQVEKFKIDEKKLYTVIPKNVKRENIEEFVLKACEFYSKHLKNRELER
jgi:ParB family chromosome partitioning protein